MAPAWNLPLTQMDDSSHSDRLRQTLHRPDSKGPYRTFLFETHASAVLAAHQQPFRFHRLPHPAPRMGCRRSAVTARWWFTAPRLMLEPEARMCSLLQFASLQQLIACRPTLNSQQVQEGSRPTSTQVSCHLLLRDIGPPSILVHPISCHLSQTGSPKFILPQRPIRKPLRVCMLEVPDGAASRCRRTHRVR